ncbi:small ubiquitin-related modifier 3-like isoform X1 [Melospiza georgiana]|uniref:small ubiquitin-related modifier 3-like isoform X1 n=1 Tax=Melospiza georgiana TaxID=44398 RepID=UPI0025AD24F1|nr:small ubiquitin-related modifier 3-like isoform X1 [Melospiza georgiana]
MSEEKPPEGVKTENEHIDLRVAGQDGSVVQFRIKRHTPLSKLMQAYCCRQVGEVAPPVSPAAYCTVVTCVPLVLHSEIKCGFSSVTLNLQGLSMRYIMFLFDGKPIKEADTPAQLEMEHDDTIEVYQQQTGGGC